MSTIEQSIDVNVPCARRTISGRSSKSFRASWKACARFRQLGDKRLAWCAEIGGKEKRWEAEITEQIPDARIAWRSRTGANNAGRRDVPSSRRPNDRVMLQLDYDPEGVVENVGDASGRGQRARARGPRPFQGFHRAARQRDRRLAWLDQRAARVSVGKED
jgi:hypothetical protein